MDEMIEDDSGSPLHAAKFDVQKAVKIKFGETPSAALIEKNNINAMSQSLVEPSSQPY
jgi:hypothetical protein